MIPNTDVDLTRDEQARWKLTRLAAALVLDGISPDLIMLDVREGINLARRASLRSQPELGRWS